MIPSVSEIIQFKFTEKPTIENAVVIEAEESRSIVRYGLASFRL